jgi:hypothetical protein
VDIAVELFELYRLHLIKAESEGFWLNVGEIVPERAELTGPGNLLYSLMQLESIPPSDLTSVLSLVQLTAG